MTSYRILYLAADAGEAFRAGSPGKPPFLLHRSRYETGPEVAADNPYALWQRLREQCEAGIPRPVAVGDVLETADSVLLCNYWGFDVAAWAEQPHANGPAAAADAAHGTRQPDSGS